MSLRDTLTKNVCLYTLLVIFLVLTLTPIVYMVLISITPARELWHSLIPKHPTLESYFAFLKKEQHVRYFLNTWILTGSATLFTLTLGFVGGYGLSRFRFRGQNTFILSLLFTQAFAPITLSVSYFRIAKILHLYNTYSFLVLLYVGICLPFSTLILRAFLDTIPREIEEAALIDGCSPIALFFRILIPLSWPGLIAAGLFTFIGSWNQYLYPLLFTSSWEKAPITVLLSTLKGHFVTDWNGIMAVSLFTCFPAMIFFLVFSKHFITGLTKGGVKG